MRDDRIDAIDDGEVESVWLAEQIGRPIVKAWNATGSASLAGKGAPAGTPGRIAIPVAGDDTDARKLGMMLVDQTGFDGPKMIELSGERADGAHPYLVLPEQTRKTRAILGEDPWIVTEQAVAIGGRPGDQLRRAHTHLDLYSRLDNYRNSWLRQGFDETDLVVGGSERLARALVGMGTAEEAAASVTAHLDAGADHVVVQVAVDAPTDDPLPNLRALAAALGL